MARVQAEALSEEFMLPGESRQYVFTAPKAVRETFFHVMRTGVISYRRGYALRRSSLDELLVAYFDRGTFRLRTGGVESDVHAGQFMVVDCLRTHEFEALEDCHDVFLHFNGPMARAYCDYLVSRRGNVIDLADPLPAAGELKAIFDSFAEGRGTANPVGMSLRIDSLLTSLMSGRRRGASPDGGRSAVRKAIAHIADHLDGDLSLDALAAVTNVSKFHLARLFRSETGSSIHEYVVEARLERAKYLLAYTSDPIGAVGARCGFSGAGNFSAAFAKGVGMAPGAFREMARRG